MFHKIFCFGLCWFLKKIYRFKCGNNHKTENIFKKNCALGLGSYHNRGKKGVYGLGSDKTEAKRSLKFSFN